MSPVFTFFSTSSSSDEERDGATDDDGDPGPSTEIASNVHKIMSSMRDFSTDAVAAKRSLEQCGVPISPALVAEALSRLRDDWSAAFTFFLWASRQHGYSHSPRDYHSMISALARARRFDTAWSLVREMGERGILSTQTFVILIRRYSAARDVANSIATFYAQKRHGFEPGVEEFQQLLTALCRYKNVQDAEHLLLCNEKVFPFEIKSFNIVLNGWCNVVVVLREAKRFWKLMGVKGIKHDSISYGCMISCLSKAGDINAVLKFYNKMKKLRIKMDRKAYNAVVYALAKGNCSQEAVDLLGSMEKKGIAPDAITFNSLILPLCKAGKIVVARKVFDEMLHRGIPPSVRTFHAFFRALRTTEEVTEMLEVMKSSGCEPEIETYIMLIRKFCRWRQYDVVFKLWDEVVANGPGPDRSMYIVLIHGLFLSGRVADAHRYHEEMKGKGFSLEPSMDEMIQAWLFGKEAAGEHGFSGLEDKFGSHSEEVGTTPTQ